MNITIIGTGFVGLVSAAVYAHYGHDVIGLDIDKTKIKNIKNGEIPFHEPGLEKLLKKQQKKGNLKFSSAYSKSIKNADLILICVGTPADASGQADLKYIFASIDKFSKYIKNEAIIAIKSTIPPQAYKRITKYLKQSIKKDYKLVLLPEFLKEGSAVEDSLNPNRIIVGTQDKEVYKKIKQAHQPFKSPIMRVKPVSACLIKYAANSYLAMRITFINQIADLCEYGGGDIDEVIKGISKDKRIGSHYWYPGLGYGGSCFPKDVSQLGIYANQADIDTIFPKMHKYNEDRIEDKFKIYSKKVGRFIRKRVAVLGLSFKPNTNDTRKAPAKKIIPMLLEKKAIVQAYDPLVKLNYKNDSYTQCESIKEACKDANIIILLIAWDQIKEFDYKTIRNNQKQWILDLRNILNKKKMEKIGFDYIGIGKS